MCVHVSLPVEPVVFLTYVGWRLCLSSISLVIFYYHDSHTCYGAKAIHTTAYDIHNNDFFSFSFFPSCEQRAVLCDTMGSVSFLLFDQINFHLKGSHSNVQLVFLMEEHLLQEIG